LTFIPDVQHLIDISTPPSSYSSEDIERLDLSSLDTPYHDAYHPLEEIYAFGDALTTQFRGMLEGFEVGQSFEGTEIRGWRAHLTSNESSSDVEWEVGRKKGRKGQKGREKVSGGQIRELVVQSGQHAREVSQPYHFDTRC